jgi:hypothetical protein
MLMVRRRRVMGLAFSVLLLKPTRQLIHRKTSISIAPLRKTLPQITQVNCLSSERRPYFFQRW